MANSKQTKREKKVKLLSKIPFTIKEVSAFIVGVTTIVGAITACSSYISSKITQSTNERLDSISTQLNSLELDSTRTQLLTLMSNYPDNESEILKVAYHYFQDLNGDWYMSELFEEWAEERDIDVSKIMVVHKK